MSISFRQLEVFRAVAEMKNFTQASQKLLVSQSTVSEHIRQLEEALSTEVFDRSQRSVNLTPAGERLFEYATNIFSLLEKAEISAKYAPNEFAGRISIGCGSTTLLYLLPPVLKDFARKYPRMELQVKSYNTIQPLLSDLRSGTIEMAVVILPVSGPEIHKTILLQESFCIVLPRRHPLLKSKRKHIGIRDTLDEPFILYQQFTNTRKIIDHFFHRMKIVPKVAMQLEDIEAIKEMVASGFGISLLPESAFLVHQRNDELVRIPVPLERLKREVGLIKMRTKSFPPGAQALVDILLQRFSK